MESFVKDFLFRRTRNLFNCYCQRRAPTKGFCTTLSSRRSLATFRMCFNLRNADSRASSAWSSSALWFASFLSSSSFRWRSHLTLMKSSEFFASSSAILDSCSASLASNLLCSFSTRKARRFRRSVVWVLQSVNSLVRAAIWWGDGKFTGNYLEWFYLILQRNRLDISRWRHEPREIK